MLGAVCIAVAPAGALGSQCVKLTWNPSPDDGVVGYHVYYGTASGVYAASLEVDNVTNAQIYCVADGATYYFAVSAVDAAGDESALSAEASYTVPLPSPTTLQTQTYNNADGQPYVMAITATSSESSWWKMECSTDLQTWIPYTYGFGSEVFVLVPLTEPAEPQKFFRLAYF